MWKQTKYNAVLWYYSSMAHIHPRCNCKSNESNEDRYIQDCCIPVHTEMFCKTKTYSTLSQSQQCLQLPHYSVHRKDLARVGSLAKSLKHWKAYHHYFGIWTYNNGIRIQNQETVCLQYDNSHINTLFPMGCAYTGIQSWTSWEEIMQKTKR